MFGAYKGPKQHLYSFRVNYLKAILQNDNGKTFLRCMRKGKGNAPDAQIVCNPFGNAVKFQGGPPGRLIRHFKITPGNAAPPACSNRFHAGFFCGKSPGKAFGGICLAGAVRLFAVRVDSMEKTISESADAFGDTVYFHQIRSNAKNHSPS